MTDQNSRRNTSKINILEKQGELPLPVGEEFEEETTNMLDQLLGEDEAAMQITSPYGSEKVSTNKAKRASLGQMEERSTEYAIRNIDDEIEDIKLVMTSPGGKVSSANKIARSLSNNFENIETYVPHFAKSGGTLISLTGDEIVMGEISDLGPLDPQTSLKDKTRASSRDVLDSYERWMNEWQNKHPEEASAPERSMMNRMDILEYEEAKKAIDEIEKYAHDILSDHPNVEQAEAERAVKNLVREYPVHGYTLTTDEAQEVLPGDIITPEEEKREEMQIARRWMDQYAFDNSINHAIVYHQKK